MDIATPFDDILENIKMIKLCVIITGVDFSAARFLLNLMRVFRILHLAGLIRADYFRNNVDYNKLTGRL